MLLCARRRFVALRIGYRADPRRSYLTRDVTDPSRKTYSNWTPMAVLSPVPWQVIINSSEFMLRTICIRRTR